MEYIDPFRDSLWEEELKVHDVLSTSDFANLAQPSSGHLMAMLYSNASRISNEKYLTWLIREHGFIRIPPDLISQETVAKWTASPAQKDWLLEHFVYPLSESRFTVSIGMAHPVDERQSVYMDRIFAGFSFRQLVALTPGEALKIHRRYMEAV
jgi:hypothetical protein